MTGLGPCPRCRLPLSAARAATRHVHGCVHCGGVWLDPDLARQVAHALEPELHTMAEIAARHAQAIVDAAQPAHCPECHVPLHRFQVTRARIELDACGAHGTWFDRGELGKVSRELAIERAYAPGPGAARGQRAGHLAAAAAVGMAGVGGVAVAQQFANQRPPDERAEVAAEVADIAFEVGGETMLHGIEVSAEALTNGADFMGGAAGVAGTVVEIGGTVLEGTLSVLGSIFEGFG